MPTRMRAVTTQSLPAVETAALRAREKMSWRRCRSLIASDLFRYDGAINARQFWRHFFFTPGFRYSVALRIARYTRLQRWTRFGLRQFMAVAARHPVPQLRAFDRHAHWWSRGRVLQN